MRIMEFGDYKLQEISSLYIWGQNVNIQNVGML